MRVGIAAKTNLPDLRVSKITLTGVDGSRFAITRDESIYSIENGLFSMEWRGAIINGDPGIRVRDLPVCEDIDVGFLLDQRADGERPIVAAMELVLVDDDGPGAETRCYKVCDLTAAPEQGTTKEGE